MSEKPSESSPFNRQISRRKLLETAGKVGAGALVAGSLVGPAAATRKKIAMDVVVVVQFRGDKLACERIYWDHAAVLRQAGLIKA